MISLLVISSAGLTILWSRFPNPYPIDNISIDVIVNFVKQGYIPFELHVKKLHTVHVS